MAAASTPMQALQPGVSESGLLSLVWDSIPVPIRQPYTYTHIIRVVVKIMVTFWVLSIIRRLSLGDPKGDHNVDKHPI